MGSTYKEVVEIGCETREPNRSMSTEASTKVQKRLLLDTAHPVIAPQVQFPKLYLKCVLPPCDNSLIAKPSMMEYATNKTRDYTFGT
jgi:hypothetical protein